MSIQLTQQELLELSQKFTTVELNEDSGFITNTVPLSTGRYVKGYLSEDGTFIVKSVSALLCG